VPLPDCADGVLLALRSLSSAPRLDKIDAAALLSERARLMELGRSGPVSPGGTCRIINTATKPIALNMARETDWQMLPALFKHDCVASWAAIIEHCQQTEADALVEQGRVLGMAITNCPSELAGDDWLITEHFSATRRSALKRPRVLDLSSLWAGPLCSSLLHFLGAKVLKVECSNRPDGARLGNQTFFQLINQGKRGVSLDLRSERGQTQLAALIEQSDIIIEASRPRALLQMGIDARQILQRHPGKSWVSITAYGREAPQSQYIGFGDDVGVAAGLSDIMRTVHGEYSIVGDAIADPLTGMHAALAAWASWQAGGGHLLQLSLYATLKHCISRTSPADNNYSKRWQHWIHHLRTTDQPVKRLPLREITQVAPSLGQHNQAVKQELAFPC
jgi:hypothetical protein